MIIKIPGNPIAKKRPRKTAIKKNDCPIEAWEQEQIFRWKAVAQILDPRLSFLHGSLAGIRLSPGLAKKAKAQGNTPGIPDICLPVKSGQYSGLFIELKRQKGGSISEDQKRWLAFLNSQGFRAVVCEGWHNAVATIKHYLEMG